MRFSKQQKIIIGAVALVLIIIVGTLVFHRTSETGSLERLASGEVKANGHFVCLALRSKDVTPTICQLGLTGDDGTIYGLDTSSASSMDPNITPTDRISVVGELAEDAALRSELFMPFEAAKVINVHTITKAT